MKTKSIQGIIDSLKTKYVNKEYRECRELILTNKKSFDLAVFHYNLGTVYLKEGDYGAGRYHLEKSLILNYYNPHLFYNLKEAKQKIIQGTQENFFSFDKTLFKLYELPTSIFFTLTLILLIFSIELITRKILKKFGTIIIIILIFVPLFFLKIYFMDINRAIVLKDTKIYRGPSKIFLERKEIKSGTKIIFKEVNDNWFRIIYPKRHRGWIDRKKIGII